MLGIRGIRRFGHESNLSAAIDSEVPNRFGGERELR
jgi:hypothetical protein